MIPFETPFDILRNRVTALQQRIQTEVNIPQQQAQGAVIAAENNINAFNQANPNVVDWLSNGNPVDSPYFPFGESVRSTLIRLRNELETARANYTNAINTLNPLYRALESEANAIARSPEYQQAMLLHEYIRRWRYDPNPVLNGIINGYSSGKGREFVKYYELMRSEGRVMSAAINRYYPFVKQAIEYVDNASISPLVKFQFLQTWETEVSNPNFPHLRRHIIEGANINQEAGAVIAIGKAIEERKALEAKLAAEAEAAKLAAKAQVSVAGVADPAGSIIVSTPAVMPSAPQILGAPVAAVDTPAPAPQPVPAVITPAVQATIQQAAAVIQQQPKAADGLTQADLQTAIAQAVAAARPTQQGATPEQVNAAIAQAVAAVKSEAETAKKEAKPALTVDDIQAVVASAVSRASEKTASEVAATPSVAQIAEAGGNWFMQKNAGLPNWAWVAIGTVALAGIGGGIWYTTKSE